ncbi:MAG: winged helix-turn-helix transcriptional regulator [Firmicutes bacterium]|nr:winged helix-turn-helix transcriptional regulator [Bacillota bacterium]MBQ3123420.1 winged helix-turn-helix transcriptional regulator [Bacillota bacterium]MBQ9973319.1 winged helix-turn-helix transcriptional regulator [Bacillota bacterium]
MHKLPHDHGTNTLEIFEKSYENKSFEEVADLFSLVADSTRLKIFSLLCHTEDCVINIAAAVGMSSPAVSHHLRVLKQSHLIGSRKVGKEVYYTVAETKEAELLHGAVDRMMEICCNK